MKRIVLNMILVLILAFVPVWVLGSTAYAAACPSSATARGQVLKGIGEAGNRCDDRGVRNILETAVQILSLVVGVAAVIMIIYSGFRYITSGGESGRVASAKSTLIYALVGLAIAALAQFMAHFVLNQAGSAARSTCPAGQYRPAAGGACRR